MRLLAGDMLADEDIVASVVAMRDELDRVDALLSESEQRAATLPHRTRHLMLAQSLGHHIVAAYRTWIDEVERELAPRGRRT